VRHRRVRRVCPASRDSIWPGYTAAPRVATWAPPGRADSGRYRSCAATGQLLQRRPRPGGRAHRRRRAQRQGCRPAHLRRAPSVPDEMAGIPGLTVLWLL
jgi:hypothetical protein